MASKVTRNPSNLNRPLTVTSTSSQLKLAYDADSFGTIDVNSVSTVEITAAESGNVELAGNNIVFSNNAGGTHSALSMSSGGGKWSTAGGPAYIDAAGAVILDSATGEFEMKGAGTNAKFADMYAGMILGYTRISNDSTTTGHAEITSDATMTVLQTVQGTDVSVTFIAPPSGNVEISMLCSVYASSRTLEFALSDNASFNEIAETHTYDAGAQSSDETDQNMTYVSFVNTGLTAGTEYERWIGAAETISGTSNIRHGRNRTSGEHYPPIIVKAIALPATIVTGE